MLFNEDYLRTLAGIGVLVGCEILDRVGERDLQLGLVVEDIREVAVAGGSVGVCEAGVGWPVFLAICSLGQYCW